MKVLSLARYAFGVAAGVALLAGCSANGSTPSLGGSSSSPVAPMVNHGKLDFATFNKLVAMTNVNHKGVPTAIHPLTHSWHKAPPPGTTGTLWATDVSYASLDQIAYPSGTLVGQISGFSFPQGDCSDKSGNVYVADAGTDYGYEVSGGAITKSWYLGGGYAIGCSVSNSGDVSFTQFYTIQGYYAYPGGVWVFPGGGPTGTFYAGPGYDWPAGYDKNGNLYVECNYASPCSSPHVAELMGSTWTFLNANFTVYFPGATQAMGKLIGFGDQEPSGAYYTGIHLTKVSGSSATSNKTVVMQGNSGGTGCTSNYMDDSTSWGEIGKKPNGIGPKKVKNLAAPNLWCYPSPVNIYKKSGGAPTSALYPAGNYQDDYGVTFTSP